MRHDAADVDDGFCLDAQENELCAISRYRFKWNVREPQKAGRINRSSEAIDEGGFHLVEIGLVVGVDGMVMCRFFEMGRLPLCYHGCAGAVVTSARQRKGGTAATEMLIEIVIMSAMHGLCPDFLQKVTGLSMMALCAPSLPWATKEPSTSTTTRTPTSAVMSDVS